LVGVIVAGAIKAELSLEELSLVTATELTVVDPAWERHAGRAGSSRRNEASTGATGVLGLLLLLTLGLGDDLGLVLLCLHGLQSQDLQLHHLHLESLSLSLRILLRLIAETGAEGKAVRVHAPLLLHEPIVGAINSGSQRHLSTIEHRVLARKIAYLIALVFLAVLEDHRIGIILGNGANVEGAAWCCGMGDTIGERR